MNLDKSYELQVYARGNWNVVAIFDDRRLSEVEARVIRRSRRYVAIRIREEVYDQVLAAFRSRVIYHYSQAEQKPAPFDGFSFARADDAAEQASAGGGLIATLAEWLHAPLSISEKLDRFFKGLLLVVCLGNLLVVALWVHHFWQHH